MPLRWSRSLLGVKFDLGDYSRQMKLTQLANRYGIDGSGGADNSWASKSNLTNRNPIHKLKTRGQMGKELKEGILAEGKVYNYRREDYRDGLGNEKSYGTTNQT